VEISGGFVNDINGVVGFDLKLINLLIGGGCA